MNQRSTTGMLLRVAGPLAPVLILVLAVMFLLGFVMVMVDTASQQPPAGACPGQGPGVQVPITGLPARVGNWSGQQLVNAALIANAAQALGLPRRAQYLGVQAAMGESTLTVLDRGDAVGRDSRGLFQQRANGAWGSYADRMNPTISATNFLKALQRVPGWETLTPTLAIHQVQRNADPYYYTPFWNQAVQVVDALAGVTVGTPTVQPVSLTGPGTPPGTGACGSTPQPGDGSINAGGWTLPAIGRTSSGYGMRWGVMHKGQDIAAPCGTAVWAAQAGTVVQAGRSSGYGNLIAIDHGGGVVTRYAHSFDPDVLVHVGETVTAGQQIARVGTFGDSTGCHLHTEVLVNGQFVDPVPFYTAKGVNL